MGQKLVTCCRPPPPSPVDSQKERKSQHALLPSPSLEQPKRRSISDTSMSSSLLCEMPAELLLYNILPYLTYVDLCHLSQVNTFLHNLLEATADEDSAGHLWTKCVKDEMLENFIERDINMTYVAFDKEAVKASVRVCANRWLTRTRLSQHQQLMDEKKVILTVRPRFYPRSTGGDTEYHAEQYHTLSTGATADTAPKEREFQNEKSKFQYLFMKRKEQVNPWTQAKSVRCGGCTGMSRTDYNWQLYSRYITIYPTTNPIKREHEKDKLCIYYEHGQLNPVAKMDNHSRYLVTELERPEHDPYCLRLYVGLIKCLKCEKKVLLPPPPPPANEQQPKPYNWYVSYTLRGARHTDDRHGHRMEYIEIYCPICQRYSLWKCDAQPQKWFPALGGTSKKRPKS
ncbi:unnamed protein product [Didymodactylos carnosus]|uniref:F-box domain-containing protein n=1 Tax=Didymodactylos carnosus TaxID=1234261 RepID=A0A815Q5F9_9BILA|nr:unnamed protein product [Didymodactylos carnosus]CAF4329792.1 unnamed protein product [Didymodactylos carnosus]